MPNMYYAREVRRNLFLVGWLSILTLIVVLVFLLWYGVEGGLGAGQSFISFPIEAFLVCVGVGVFAFVVVLIWYSIQLVKLRERRVPRRF